MRNQGFREPQQLSQISEFDSDQLNPQDLVPLFVIFDKVFTSDLIWRADIIYDIPVCRAVDMSKRRRGARPRHRQQTSPQPRDHSQLRQTKATVIPEGWQHREALRQVACSRARLSRVEVSSRGSINLFVRSHERAWGHKRHSYMASWIRQYRIRVLW